MLKVFQAHADDEYKTFSMIFLRTYIQKITPTLKLVFAGCPCYMQFL